MKKIIYLWRITFIIIGVQNINAQVTGIGCLPSFQTLVEGSSGILYGMTSHGGDYNKGVLFSYNPISGNYSDLVHFNGDNGANPMGNLFYSSELGLFYGMTVSGGENNVGVIFSFDPDNPTDLTVLYHFSNAKENEGNRPYGSLINIPGKGQSIRLYGLANQGGVCGGGVIFKFDPDPTVLEYTRIEDMAHINGNPAFPIGDLLYLSGNNTAYFMTQPNEVNEDYYGGIIEYNLGTTSFSYYPFNGTNGNSPYGSLIEGNSSNILYGMTNLGGSSSFGNIFEYNYSTHSITNKVSFNNSTVNGKHPYGCLKYFSNNELYYGFTYEGGDYEKGILFSWDNNTNPGISTVHEFNYSMLIPDGAFPLGSLMRYQDTLYGMTNAGGNNNVGTIIKYVPNDITSYDKKVNFSCINYDLGDNFTGINVVNSNKVIIYPNPASDYVMINNAENANIKVYSMLGNIVMDISNICNEYKMDIKSLSQGTYLVKIIQNNQLITKRINLIK